MWVRLGPEFDGIVLEVICYVDDTGWFSAGRELGGPGGGGEGAGAGVGGNGRAFIGLQIPGGAHDLGVDVHAAFVKGAGQGRFGIPDVGAPAEVAVAEIDGLAEIGVGEGVEFDGPEFEVGVAGV